jgi:hypothetical protein
MKKLLRNPMTNAVCTSVFTMFYSLIFIISSGRAEFQELLYHSGSRLNVSEFWEGWSGFLRAGHQQYIAYILIALTMIAVFLLIRRRNYDEYHTQILMQCLVVALILTMIAIALFFLIILRDLNWAVEKFTLFIAIHWATVVLSDLAYILICKGR